MSPTSGLVLITSAGGSKLGCIIPVDVLNNHGDRKSPKDPVVESLSKWQRKTPLAEKMGGDPTTFELQPPF